MEFFSGALFIRLRSVHNKYLAVKRGGPGVQLQRDGSSLNARWMVEIVQDEDESYKVRLRGYDGDYLVPQYEEESLLGLTGKKVALDYPSLPVYANWRPERVENDMVVLFEVFGRYLRANAGIPPWLNTVTVSYHPKSKFTQLWILWRVEVLVPHVEPQLLWPATRKSPRVAIVPRTGSNDPNKGHPGTHSRTVADSASGFQSSVVDEDVRVHGGQNCSPIGLISTADVSSTRP